MEKHTHTITRGDKTYTVSVFENDTGYTFNADPDPERTSIGFGTLSEIVHAFAMWQLSIPDITADPVVSFDDDESGQLIVNPWYDPSGRFPHTTVDSVRRYGVQNVAKFISEAVIFLFDLKEVKDHE